MKRIIFLLIIICLALIAFFEWTAYKRAHIPSTFIYETSDSLDLAFHDPKLIASYFEEAADLERYGRYCWKAYRLDVRADRPIESPKKELAAAYQQKLAWVKQTEATLTRSYLLKQQGIAANQVKLMLSEGLTQQEAKVKLLLGEHDVLELEDQGEAVYKVQKLLNAKGYDLPVDGYFERQTLQAIQEFQKSVGIYPTGKVGDLTIKKLLE